MISAAALRLAAAIIGAACPAGAPHAPAALPAPPPGATYLDHDGAVRIVGYNDMRAMFEGWDAALALRFPSGVRFALDLPSTRSAPAALIEGRSAMAPMGAEMTRDDLREAAAEFGAAPIMIRVAHDSLDARALSGPLGLVVANDSPLAALTLGQIAQIYAAGGALTTWGQLGLKGVWAHEPIHRLGLRPETALGQWLQARLFAGRAFAPDLVGFGHSDEVVRAVARDPLAIGFASLNVPVTDVKVLPISRGPGRAPVAPTRLALQTGSYPLDRQLLIYAHRPLDPFVRGYLMLVLSCEGQAVVAADPAGYIPLTPAQAAAEREKLAEGAEPSAVVTLQRRGRRSRRASP
jgi:phosphate transport system substrate-binding protein